MKLLDRDASQAEIREFHRRMCAADQLLRDRGIHSEKIHGWCGAESENISYTVRLNMWYIHISSLLRQVYSGERPSRRKGRTIVRRR